MFSAYGSPSELKVSDLTSENLALKISSGNNIHKSWRIILYLNDRKNIVIYRYFFFLRLRKTPHIPEQEFHHWVAKNFCIYLGLLLLILIMIIKIISSRYTELRLLKWDRFTVIIAAVSSK